jgi:integrase
VLASILRFANDRGIIAVNPMDALKFPTYEEEEVEEQPRAPTPTFVEYVLSLLERDVDKLVVELMAYAGARQEEAVAVVNSAVRLTPNLLLLNRTIVRGRFWHIKNRRPHSVPLLASPRARLKARLDQVPEALSDWLLVSSAAGAPWSQADCSSFRQRFMRASRQVPGETFTPRDLRAHYVTMMIESGTPPEVVAEHIGDNVETVLRHYYRVRDDPDRSLPPDEQIGRARARVAAAPIVRNIGGRPKRRPEAA